MARVTLADIAGELGLSKFAVSRALSGKDGVSDETRRRVESVAAQMGYVKLVTASRLPSVALVFNDTDYINSELQLMVQAGVQAEAKRRGEIAAHKNPAALAKFFVATIQGMRALARLNHDRQELEQVARTALAALE